MLRFSWRCYPSCALSCSLCAADCVLAPADFSLAADFCLRKPRTSSEPNLSFNTTLRNLGQTQSKTSINQPQNTKHTKTTGHQPYIFTIRENSTLRNCFGNHVFFDLLFCAPVFLAICSILELEAAVSTVFVIFWSWNLSFSLDFATFWWNL
jgi:hypothetical protein